MGRIPQETIDDVLARSDILQVVGQYVSLKRAGTNHKGLCPFHDEKTPSFLVHPGKGIYKCFGCGAAGNVFRFLMELEGWSFPEAVRQLAGRVGVEIPAESEEDAAQERQRQQARDMYRRIMTVAREYYEQCLWGEGGEVAREYLAQRGIDTQTARAFGMGYAPEGWQNLLDHADQKGIHGALLERAGLAISKRDGHYDRFRERVMFPVIDIWGHTLAFGGRVLPGDDGPKYINSSETRFYTKGHQLFGLHASKSGIQKAEYALLVEGNFDVITLHATGVEMAVAPMGTAFTERQARLLKRYCPRVVIAFDGDGAGTQATSRCLEAAEAAGLEASVIRFGSEDDPDTFVRREGAKALFDKIGRATPLVAWSIEQIMPMGGSAEHMPIEERIRVLEQAAPIMEQVREPIVWKHYAEDLSRRLDIEPRLFKRYLKSPERAREDMGAARDDSRSPSSAPVAPLTLSTTEFTLLTLLLAHPEWLGGFLDEQLENMLQSEELASLLQIARPIIGEGGAGQMANLLEAVEEPALQRTLLDAMSASERHDRIVDSVADPEALNLSEKAAQTFEDTLRTLKIEWADRSLREVDRAQQEAFTTQDYSKSRALLAEINTQRKALQQFKMSLTQGR